MPVCHCALTGYFLCISQVVRSLLSLRRSTHHDDVVELQSLFLQCCLPGRREVINAFELLYLIVHLLNLF
uniref:Uncharacterized protein n=1 Tax=Aegilops tauschii subsp. strangulata TaxID=200361 RepID=A0A453HWR5_AEGTS